MFSGVWAADSGALRQAADVDHAAKVGMRARDHVSSPGHGFSGGEFVCVNLLRFPLWRDFEDVDAIECALVTIRPEAEFEFRLLRQVNRDSDLLPFIGRLLSSLESHTAA